MTTFEDADVAGDVDGAKPLGYGQAVDGYSECGSDMCYVDAVTSGGRWREDVGWERGDK